MKCGFVTVLGMPNAGKSTLINNIVGSKVSIITPKAQTTRNCINGIAIMGETQIVLIDTPGIFSGVKADRAQKNMHRNMISSAWGSLKRADIVIVLVDAKRGISEDVKTIISKVKKAEINAVLALNKIDLVNPPILLALAKELNDLHDFKYTFMISALKGEGVEDLKLYLQKNAPESPWAYPKDDITDLPARFIASEITREQVFLNFSEEVPYFTTVATESWKEQEKSIDIHQVIYVARESQKKIIIGKGGAGIKKIGETSRKELQKLLGKKINLFLFVKVKKDWMDDISLIGGVV